MEPLLTTKLHIPPPRPEHLPRPRLIERLNNGLHRTLTLISAPVGFGKTTLVSEWIATCNRPVAWLSLDERDNDPIRFLTYLVATLQTDDPEIKKRALAVLKSPQPLPIDSTLTVLLNEITAISEPFALVLDDFHLIHDPTIEYAIAFLLEHPPPQMHLVIITREDPQFPLARLRACGQMTELRAADLRFTPDEAADFLNQVMRLNLTAEGVVTLETRTEGWIAGLQLAAVSIRGHKNTAALIKSFSGCHRFILDYLIEEVLDQQSEAIQNFLLQTAILDRFTGSLCDALTGESTGQMTLETLERANLFIIPLDNERRWYRYHHLFSDLLRQRLQQIHPDWVSGLHLKASKWYERNGFADDAIDHALHGAHHKRAADLIENSVDDVWQLGEQVRLRRWLEGLPVELVYARPHLAILHAGNLYTRGQIADAEERLAAAEQILVPDGLNGAEPVGCKPPHQFNGHKQKLRGRAMAIRAHLASYRGDLQGAIQYARQALDYLPRGDLAWRSTTFDSIGTAYSSIGDVVSAYQARAAAVEASKATGNVYMILYASLRLVVTLRDLGRLQDAVEICQQQLALANQNGLSQTAVVGWLFTLWGEILAERNELDRAMQLVNQGIALTERGKDVALIGSSYLCLMRVLFSRGDMEKAEATIQKVHNTIPRQDLSPWITIQLAAWGARIALAGDRLDSASQWVEECNRDIYGELRPLYDFDYVVLARILIAQQRLDEANHLLQRLFNAADVGGRISKVIEVRILQALALQASSSISHALRLLEQALTLAEPGGFMRSFVDEGLPMARLLYEAAANGIAPDYTRRLLAVFPVGTPQPSPAIDLDGLIDPLSEREMDVLQLIAVGLTNPEIAARLFLARNTVKVHTRSIYDKLGVHNRTQAVARARALGILLLL